jgi:hypothetical protein
MVNRTRQQIVGDDGEHLVADELIKRGWQRVRLLRRNAPDYDLRAIGHDGWPIAVQVKTCSTGRSWSPPSGLRINSRRAFLIFVRTDGGAPRYWVIPSTELAKLKELGRGQRQKYIQRYAGAWHLLAG